MNNDPNRELRRNALATAALTGLAAAYPTAPECAARVAYEMADAMLAIQEKKPERK